MSASTSHQSYGLDEARASFDGAVEVTAWRDGPPYFITPRAVQLKADRTVATRWLNDHRRALDELLLGVGCFVLRGFPVDNTDDFDVVMSSFPGAAIDYLGGSSPRLAISGRVYESSHAPAEIIIPLHQEMAYLPKFPSRLAFYCHVPPRSDGETLLASIRDFEPALDPGFVSKLRDRGVTYRRNFRAPGTPLHPVLAAVHREWTKAFLTDDPLKAESACDEMGLTHWWNEDGSLTAEYQASGFNEHPVTGETLWFNSLASQSLHPRGIGPSAWNLIEQHYPPGRTRGYDTRFGDGTPIDPDDITRIYDATDKLVIKFPWQHGDVLVIDNFLTAHGRNHFIGDREVQAMLLG